MGKAKANFAGQRELMVYRELRGRDIHDERVLEAMGKVPREKFVSPGDQRDAYGDHPLPIGCGQTISQPYIVALMTQELDVRAAHRVLDVGAGSGYQTAILAMLAKEVFGIERIAELTGRAGATLAELGITNVTLTTGDGTLGWPEHAPYDRIVCGAAGPDVPPAWGEQLADGGRIVMPIGEAHVQTLIAVDKQAGKLIRRNICGVRFVKLIGKQGWPDGP